MSALLPLEKNIHGNILYVNFVPNFYKVGLHCFCVKCGVMFGTKVDILAKKWQYNNSLNNLFGILYVLLHILSCL